MAPVLNPQIIMLDEIMESLDDAKEVLPDSKVSVWIKDKDLIRASTDITLMKEINPGIYTVDYNKNIGFFCSKINVKSDELFLFSDSITNKLLSEIKLFWEKADLYRENNLIHKRGILLEGYPGTGKSSIISILSSEIIKQGGVVFKVNGDRNLGDYIEFIRTSFRKIQPDTPIITILEDLDMYEDVEEELLDFLDGKTHLDHHVVIATTNNTESIPDTYLRPSRIDLKFEIPLPTSKIRSEYFKYKKVPENNLKELVDKSEGCSLADLKELYICIYLLNYTIDEAISKIKSPREKKCFLDSPQAKSRLGF